MVTLRATGRPYAYPSDVWAAGCVLVELLSGTPAFTAATIPALTDRILAGNLTAELPSDDAPTAALSEIARSVLTVDEASRPTVGALLDAPALRAAVEWTARHEAVLQCSTNRDGARIGAVEIPLVGYGADAPKTTFAQRPTFIEGGRKIVDETKPISDHESKLLAVRQRRQRQRAQRQPGGSLGEYERRLSSEVYQGSGGAGGGGGGAGGSGAAVSSSSAAAAHGATVSSNPLSEPDALAKSFSVPAGIDLGGGGSAGSGRVDLGARANFGAGGIVGFLDAKHGRPPG